MIYGYTRVSTKKQVEGYGLEVQKNEIANKYPTAVILEEQYTGTKLDRPIFNELLDKLQADDILVVSKLDRFARNTVEGIKVVEQLFKKGSHSHFKYWFIRRYSNGTFLLNNYACRCRTRKKYDCGKNTNRQRIGKASTWW